MSREKYTSMEESEEDYKCPGCQRPELHKMCPAWNTPYYMTGTPFTEEVEKEYYKELNLKKKYFYFVYVYGI